MIRVGLASTLGLLNVLLGCSGDDHGTAQLDGFPRDQTCGLRVELTGDITASATGNDTEFTCLTGFGPETDGFFVAFEPAQPKGMRIFQLRVSDAKAGAAGADLPAMVSVDDGGTIAASASSCSVDIEQRFLATVEALGGELYRVSGHGRCTSAAVSLPAGSSVHIGPFEFVAMIVWESTGSRN